MDALRTELREYFWDGEFRDKVGAQATVDGQPHHPYSVFLNHENGKHSVVIAKYEADKPVTARIKLDNHQLLNRHRLVDDPAWHSTNHGIVIPPLSAAMLLG